MIAAGKFAMGILMMCLGPLWAGSIEGLVTDEGEQPFANVSIHLEDDFGSEWTETTDMGGFYRFSDLPAGWYTLTLQEPPGFLLADPPCGYYRRFLDAAETEAADFQMESRGSGVVVELGGPVGQTFGDELVLTGSHFSISVFAYNLNSMFPQALDRLRIRGRWYIQGVGPLNADVVGGAPAGVYANSGMTVSYQNLGGNQVELVLQRNPWPHINQDGELASFSFQVLSGLTDLSQAAGRVAFCIEDLQFRWKNGLILSNTDYFVGTLD